MNMIFKAFAVFCLFIIATLNDSEAIEIKRANDQLYLYDKSCVAVEDATASLAKWAKSTNVNGKCSIDHLKPEQNSNGMCSFNITNCVPDHVRQFQGQYSDMGPNCYNLAMVVKGILPALRYSTPEEMSFYLKPPICRKIQNSSLMPGDVGIIKGSKDGIPDHAFIYVSKNLIYNKPNSSSNDPYQLTTYSQMSSQQKNALARYYKAADITTSFYRCQSMQSYLDSSKNIPEIILNSLNKIQTFERCFERKIVLRSYDPLPETAKRNILDTTKALAEYLKQEVNKTNAQTDEKTQFLLGSLQLRLDAISQQLAIQAFEHRDADSSSLEDELKPLRDTIKASLKKLGIQK